MAELQTPQEGQPNDSLRLALQICSDLFQDKSYAKLGEDDLRDQGIIPPEQALPNFMMDRLGLNRSLQQEAMAKLVASIPSAHDTSLVEQVLTTNLLSEQEEIELKMHALGEENNLMESLAASSGVRVFAGEVLARSAIWTMAENENEKTFDPEIIRSDPQLTEAILNNEPRATALPGKAGENQRFYSLDVPRRAKSKARGFIGGFAPTLDEEIVVVDPESNSELSDYLFSHPDLLKYYFGQSLLELVREKRYNLDRVFGQAAIDKHEQIKKEVAQLNIPLHLRLFNLLLQDAKDKGTLTLLDIFRDDEDVAVLKGERSPEEDREGLESGVEEYQIQTEEDKLLFSWDGDEVHFETVERDGKPRREAIYTPTTFQVYVRPNSEKDNMLEYGVKNDQGEIEWVTGEEYTNSPASKIQSLFTWEIRAISEEQRIRKGEVAVYEAQRLINQLNGTKSSVEFFMKARDFGMFGYPAHELIVNTNRRLHYIIDQFPRNPPSNPRGN